MITLHHLNNSRSQRILWLLEELGLDYKIEFYERDPKTILAPDSLKKVHPLGKSPIITDDQTGITLAESGAIIEYLIETYGEQFKAPREEHWNNVYWLHFAEGSLMPPMVMRLVFTKMKQSPMPFFIKPIARMLADKVLSMFVNPNNKRNLEYVENHLSQNTYFCGDQVSAADFQMSFPLEASVARGMIREDNYPHMFDYVKRFQARDAYKRGLEKGGEYDYA